MQTSINLQEPFTYSIIPLIIVICLAVIETWYFIYSKKTKEKVKVEENKVKVKKLIFVCGFNNYLGINEEYDNVNKSMYFDNLEDVKQYADEIICCYSDNDPYVKYEVEKEFADKIATEQVLIPHGGHINSEAGYDTFEEIVSYL